MINDDTLIKFVRSRGNLYNWPDEVNLIKSNLERTKRGFPGIRNDHLSLLKFKDINIGDLFIFDTNFDKLNFDEAPVMFKLLENNLGYVEGIGIGIDSRDPYRVIYRWKDIVDLSMFQINNNSTIFKVDIKPSLSGGPGYYYFFKSYRDFRI